MALKMLWGRKGLREFIIKTIVFVALFLLIQLVLVPLQKVQLGSAFYPILNPDIGQALLFTIIAFFLLVRTKLMKLPRSNFKWLPALFFGTVTVLLIVTYTIFKKWVSANALSYPEWLWALVTWRYTHLLLITVALAIAVYGLPLLKDLFKRYRREIVIAAVLFVAALLVVVFIKSLWIYLSTIVATVIKWVLSLTFPVVRSSTYSKSGPLVGVDDFSAIIGASCSGLDSIMLFTSLFAFILLLDWKVLNKKKMAALFIPGIAGIFAINILRVYLLMLVGIYVSKDFALGLFHSNIGWILFIIYFIVFWLALYNWVKK